MDYLKTLNDIKDSLEDGKELITSQKITLIDLISKEEEVVRIEDDPFTYFYKDVINKELDFDFTTAFPNNVYTLAQDNARTCTRVYTSINKIEENANLYAWLQSAIKFTDHFALHYLQEIKNEEPTLQGDAGRERSLYIQINQKANDAERAGRIMDNLYDCRNKMEHRTKNDPKRPGFVIIIPPKYRGVKKQIKKRYPEALLCFEEVFSNHYK